MKKTGSTLVSIAAISGLLNGIAINQALCDGTNSTGTGTNAVAPGKLAPVATAPNLHDCAGDNDCKGLGGCKTDAHACKFKNDCKGKGGCHVTKDDVKDWEKQQKAGKGKGAAKTRVEIPA